MSPEQSQYNDAPSEEEITKNVEEDEYQNNEKSLESQSSEEKEYNPDDESDDSSEGDYSYGWGYNDAFDKPEDEEKNELDEDERYAHGLDGNNDNDS